MTGTVGTVSLPQPDQTQTFTDTLEDFEEFQDETGTGEMGEGIDQE
jgi:hypothetical protein